MSGATVIEMIELRGGTVKERRPGMIERNGEKGAEKRRGRRDRQMAPEARGRVRGDTTIHAMMTVKFVERNAVNLRNARRVGMMIHTTKTHPPVPEFPWTPSSIRLPMMPSKPQSPSHPFPARLIPYQLLLR
jgi:hypothetical protein